MEETAMDRLLLGLNAVRHSLLLLTGYYPGMDMNHEFLFLKKCLETQINLADEIAKNSDKLVSGSATNDIPKAPEADSIVNLSATVPVEPKVVMATVTGKGK